MTNRKLVFTLFFSSVFFTAAFAQPGSLDASFSSKGIKKFSFKQNVYSEITTASVADAQGNLYILGTTGYAPFVVKVLANGQLDQAFGTAGKALVSGIVGNNVFSPSAIALHNDGRIVLAGYRTTGESNTYPVIVKLTGTGAPDLSFGNGNAYVEANASGFYASFTAVHVLPGTEYIIATGGTGETFGQFLVKKVDQYGNPVDFNTDGKGDGGEITISHSPEFGSSTCSVVSGDYVYMGGNSGSGKILFTAIRTDDASYHDNFNGGNVIFDIEGETIEEIPAPTANICTSIAVASDGRVVLGGYASYESGQKKFLIFKLIKGEVLGVMPKIFSNGAYDSRISSLALNPANDDLLVCGTSAAEDKSDFNRIVAHLDKENVLDAGFTGGSIQTYPGATNQWGITGVSRLSNGTYLMVASVADDVNVKKIAANGSALNMGTNTELVIGVGGADSYIHDISIRKDGQIFVVGYYFNHTINLKIPVLASLKSDGTLDPSFGGKDGADPGVINLNNVLPGAIQIDLKATAIQIQDDNKILLAGRYLNPGEDAHDVFLVRLSSTGVLETTFNNGNGYAGFGLSEGYAHDIAIQKDNKILVYGYAYNGTNSGAALARFSSSGILDVSFAATDNPSPGIFIYPQSYPSDWENQKVEVKIQPTDQKIVCVATYIVDNNGDFMAFRLDDKGELDPEFGGGDGVFIEGFPGGDDDVAMTLCLKPDGKIILGGFVQHQGEGSYTNYGLVQLTSAGILDNTFGSKKDGMHELTVNDGYLNHWVHSLEVENNTNIVALGMVQQYFEGPLSYSVLRFNATGVLDNTFSGRGQHILPAKGLAYGSALYNGSLYLAGGDGHPQIDSPLSAQLLKLKLGTGPVIKSTTIQLSNLQKTYGDSDFYLRPVSNSPAPVQYSITHGSCATVDAASGLVKIKCAPLNPDQFIEIKAYQPAVSGFTEDDVYITLDVARAIPKISFVSQGGLIDSTILLKVVTDSKGSVGYDEAQDPDDVLQFLGGGNVYINRVGCAKVMVSVTPTQNHLAGSAIATVCGYEKPVAPDAFDDNFTLVHPNDTEAILNVVSNDAAYTGTLVYSSVDLDPNAAGIQDTYVSPNLGKFTVDTLGFVTYVPFIGFTGTSFITYTIRDSQKMESQPGKINVTVSKAPTSAKEDLKATELFTPNNDGLNDAFVIGYMDDNKSNTLKIFDRNGQQLFSQDNYQNDWTGVLTNGKAVESGIYYYVFKESDGRELKGVVELRR